MWQEQAFHISADHPSAAGHFPGNPIIPGALLLDAVLHAVGQAAGTINSVKFLRAVPHGTPVKLRWQSEGAKTRFECRTGDDALVLSGMLSGPA
jgi:3-hydroxymyristoyl/3-hydroxydecanoyl-(acyl carrier protein) dehydratase